MKNGIIALFLVLIGQPASAQGNLFSPDATIACIGTSANLCTEQTEGGMTTFGTRGCLWAEYPFWDAQLDRHYKTAMTGASRPTGPL